VLSEEIRLDRLGVLAVDATGGTGSGCVHRGINDLGFVGSASGVVVSAEDQGSGCRQPKQIEAMISSIQGWQSHMFGMTGSPPRLGIGIRQHPMTVK
jgi:hypothetical protein